MSGKCVLQLIIMIDSMQLYFKNTIVEIDHNILKIQFNCSNISL